ncbi:MAG: hypothetical protein D6718_07710 [Acidobacteria bacterium]|nr:MAG: hypothetical protein D6718_07710 [Acidobacteriota bacterium]
MRRKLKVEELEARIAPSIGLLTFLRGLADTNEDFGAAFEQVVDPDGSVHVNEAAAAFNGMDTGTQVSPVVSEFTLGDNIVIPEKLADAIAEAVGKMF